MKNLKMIDTIAVILLLIGGLCWGFVGAFNMEPISSIFSGSVMLVRVIYVLIGLSAVYRIVMWAKNRK